MIASFCVDHDVLSQLVVEVKAHGIESNGNGSKKTWLNWGLLGVVRRLCSF